MNKLFSLMLLLIIGSMGSFGYSLENPNIPEHHALYHPGKYDGNDTLLNRLNGTKWTGEDSQGTYTQISFFEYGASLVTLTLKDSPTSSNKVEHDCKLRKVENSTVTIACSTLWIINLKLLSSRRGESIQYSDDQDITATLLEVRTR